MYFPPHALVISCVFTWIIKTSSGSKHSTKHPFQTDCGFRPAKQETIFSVYPKRHPRIIAGAYTKEGQFPWQASLELLHPSMGFLGHWCGGVLIHEYWVLSAAHCVHNDLFNLPIPPLWTVVLGEHDRSIETGFEQRIPVEKIVLHRNYENFLHDLVLMKLSIPADLSQKSIIRIICLPFAADEQSAAFVDTGTDDLDAFEVGIEEVPEKSDNFLRSVESVERHRGASFPSMHELMTTKILSRIKQNQSVRSNRVIMRPKRRRNDKLMRTHAKKDAIEYSGHLERNNFKSFGYQHDLPFIDCIATGWGKTNTTGGELTELLLKTPVPLHNNKRCKDAYGGFVKIHHGHLCAGKLNGKGGTCVGDSGGPLQCRVTKNGPWILAGITSFGSGCAIAGFPDVYTRTSYYMKWIQDTIALE